MSNTEPADYGPNLARYIDQRRGKLSVRKFAETHGLEHSSISGWGSGRTPSLSHLQQIATALDLTLGQVLVIMGVGTADDFQVVQGTPDVQRAIRDDPTLSTDERELLRDLIAMSLTENERLMLRELLGMFSQLRAGNESVTVRGTTNPRKRPKRT